jgi:putative nucleotidyltransferase with HDIG domain
MTRQEAWDLMTEWTQNDALRRHMLGVEAAMRWYARKHGEDEESWAVTGLLHDFDYEKYPSAPDHPLKGAEVLRAKGCPEDIVRAILGHAAWGGVTRDTLMAKVLFAVDELVGFLFACAYVQPSKSIADVKVSSVKKKLKDKGFARAVNRDEIRQGMEELGANPDEHIGGVIEALKGAAPSLGLAGSPAAPGTASEAGH